MFSKELVVIETNEIEDYYGITVLLNQTKGLSFEDCSVWYYSKKKKGALLTGDAKLRRHAEKDNVQVRGILFVFDEIVKQNLLKPAEAALKISQLKQINPRLPINELDKRIRNWEK